MAVVDADVILAIWLDEPLAEACIETLSELSSSEPLVMSDFTALEVVLRSGTALEQSVDDAFTRLTEVCEIHSLTQSELKDVVRFRTGRPSLTLGDAYSAALAVGHNDSLVSTDRRFARIPRLEPLLELVE